MEPGAPREALRTICSLLLTGLFRPRATVLQCRRPNVWLVFATWRATERCWQKTFPRRKRQKADESRAGAIDAQCMELFAC